MDWMPMAVRDGIIVVLVVSGPLVLAAAFIGLIVGILQAATQVQEQTIGSALKIIGVFGLIIVAGFWMFQYINQYTSRTISTAFTFVPRRGQKVIPSDLYKKNPEEFKNSFQEQIRAESLGSLPKITPPEKIESEIPEGGTAPGLPYLGGLEVPKPPATVEKVPSLPSIPAQPNKPDIPLGDYQEPRAIPGVPDSKKIDSLKNELLKLQQEELNVDDIDKEQLNLVPGNPIDEDDVQDELANEKPDDEVSWVD